MGCVECCDADTLVDVNDVVSLSLVLGLSLVLVLVFVFVLVLLCNALDLALTRVACC